MVFSWPWSKKESSDQIVAIIHIGSAAVSGGLALIHGGEERHTCATILESHNFDLEINPNRLSLEIYLPALYSKLDLLVNKILASEKKFGRPSQVAFFLPSLLVLSETEISSFKDEKGVKLNQSHLDDLTVKVVDKVIMENPHLYPELSADRTVFLESDTLEIVADGYKLDSGSTGSAKELTISSRVVLSSSSLIRALKERARRLQPIRATVMFKTVLSAASQVLSVIGGKHTFVIIDPTGILTDFAVVKESKIIAEGSFPKAEVTLINFIQDKLGTTRSEALSNLKLFTDNQLSGSAEKTMAKVLTDFRADWLSNLKKTLNEALAGNFLPPSIYVFGNLVAGNLFIDWLKNDGLGELTISRESPEIITVNSALWSNWCLVPQSTDSLPALSLEGVFCDSIIKP